MASCARFSAAMITLPVPPVSPPRDPSTSLDLAMIRKHAVPGPRYTSYPPATQFHENVAALDLEGAIAADNRPGAGPLSLYFHLPFCESRCWFCGCTTIITRRMDWADTYVEDVAREVELLAKHIDPSRPVSQLHLGGGTPTFFSPEALQSLGALLKRHYHFTPDAEISVEIDPRRVTAAHVGALRAMGVNRASLGIQDTNAAVQQAIHRIQPQELNRQTVQWLREAGVESISLDLIYGLPLQTAETITQTLDDALELAPDRLSIFGYAHVPWIKPAQRIFENRQQLPGPEERLALFSLMRERLLQAGYVDIGLDHFARPEDELAQAHASGRLQRNFQGYSTRAGTSLYGFGISAISQTIDSYRQNHKSLALYRAALAEGKLPVERGYRLTQDDQRRRRLVMGIMCDRRLDFAALRDELGVDVVATYAKEMARLAPLEADGLLTVDHRSLQVHPAGEPLLRVIAMQFDAYLSPERRHSSTV
jgi:oxygen-independent coproporphyrinogen III oxidase